MMKLWLAAGAVYGLIAVVLGAFGAHALRSRLSEDLLRAWHTGVDYQFYHAFALLAVGLLMRLEVIGGGLASAAGWCFLLGVLLFCGSIYGLALGGPRLLGPVTPVGGLLFMIGWVCLLLAVLKAA